MSWKIPGNCKISEYLLKNARGLTVFTLSIYHVHRVVHSFQEVPKIFSFKIKIVLLVMTGSTNFEIYYLKLFLMPGNQKLINRFSWDI